MLSLSYPWLLLLLLLPPLLRYLAPPYRQSQPAIRVPWFQRMANALGKQPAQGAVVADTKVIEHVFVAVLWLLLVLALARPHYLEQPLSQVIPTRDLMLLVDLSGSMKTQDFSNPQGQTLDRLSAVKQVLDDFLTRRQGDRVGLIVFGNAAFVQVPFTQDLEASRILLQETAVRMAGPRTAFGDAIGLAITLFERSEVEHRVIIALTDGNDTGSKVPPAEAAKIARDNDITIYVVGVGDPQASGEEKLDQDALTQVASITGGRYFHAADGKQLQSIYSELDSIDTREVEVKTHRPRRDLFHWPLAAFLLLGLVYYTAKLVLSGHPQHRSRDG
ncbi:MAG: VWA domain-containing protein [Gammaproteobacteria bacterium]